MIEPKCRYYMCVCIEPGKLLWRRVAIVTPHRHAQRINCYEMTSIRRQSVECRVSLKQCGGLQCGDDIQKWCEVHPENKHNLSSETEEYYAIFSHNRRGMIYKYATIGKKHLHRRTNFLMGTCALTDGITVSSRNKKIYITFECKTDLLALL